MQSVRINRGFVFIHHLVASFLILSKQCPSACPHQLQSYAIFVILTNFTNIFIVIYPQSVANGKIANCNFGGVNVALERVVGRRKTV